MDICDAVAFIWGWTVSTGLSEKCHFQLQGELISFPTNGRFCRAELTSGSGISFFSSSDNNSFPLIPILCKWSNCVSSASFQTPSSPRPQQWERTSELAHYPLSNSFFPLMYFSLFRISQLSSPLPNLTPPSLFKELSSHPALGPPEPQCSPQMPELLQGWFYLQPKTICPLEQRCDPDLALTDHSEMSQTFLYYFSSLSGSSRKASEWSVIN